MGEGVLYIYIESGVMAKYGVEDGSWWRCARRLQRFFKFGYSLEVWLGLMNLVPFFPVVFGVF